MRGGEGFLVESEKERRGRMMKKTDEQGKKKGMYLVATFGAVTLVALGALAVGMTNPGEGKLPKNFDLNATPTPGQPKPTDVAKEDSKEPKTPAPTMAPVEESKSDTPKNPTEDTKQTAQIQEAPEIGTEEPEDAAVLNPDGVIKGLNFSAETGMLWPVTGEALISFSPNHAIYHKTLDSYRTSNYIVLGSEVGTHVSAAADGIVTAVSEELKTGTTITMRVSENHEIIYGMLANVTVKEGDFVDAGTVFATVAEPTRYFVEDGSGVYVQVLENGTAINPMLFLQ